MKFSGTPSSSVITIGNFDGVHAGHQQLLAKTHEIAVAKGLSSGLVTFWPHPSTLLRPGIAHRPLSGRSERAGLLAAYSFDRIIELEFDRNLASLSPEEFIKKHLQPLNVSFLAIGHDFTLGSGGAGNFSVLAGLGKKYGFEVIQVPACSVDGEIVSSTRVRETLENGEVEKSARMLGRAYAICGEVIHGEGRGRALGFPTANIAPPQKLLPAPGVYATIAVIGEKSWPAVTNIGTNPTFDGKKLGIETFLLSGGENIYGREACLSFIGRIRGEIRFASSFDLVERIKKDVARAKEILAQNDFLPQ